MFRPNRWLVERSSGEDHHRWVIPREISRVLVLNLSGKKAVPKHRQDTFVLDTAFALIEGHPRFRNGKEKAGKAGPPANPYKRDWIISSGNLEKEILTPALEQKAWVKAFHMPVPA